MPAVFGQNKVDFEKILMFLQEDIRWKKEQVEIALEIRKLPRYKRTFVQNQELRVLQGRLKALKHT